VVVTLGLEVWDESGGIKMKTRMLSGVLCASLAVAGCGEY